MTPNSAEIAYMVETRFAYLINMLEKVEVSGKDTLHHERYLIGMNHCQPG